MSNAFATFSGVSPPATQSLRIFSLDDLAHCSGLLPIELLPGASGLCSRTGINQEGIQGVLQFGGNEKAAFRIGDLPGITEMTLGG